ncbi:MAG: virginiamycin B lyase family protein [Gaiellales bacterium]
MKPLAALGSRAFALALLLTLAVVGSAAAQSSTFGSTDASPNGLAIDAAGNVYTANTSAGTVTKITPSGTSSTLASTGKAPIGIAVDSSGNVYTANSGSNSVTKIAPGGTVTTLGTTGSKPIGVAIDSSGNVYTTNYLDSTVTKLTPAGVTSTLALTGEHPLGITVDSSGNVYVANEKTNNVTKITPAGVASTLGTTGGWPQAIAIDGVGNVYTANWNTRNVSKITPAGASTILGHTGRRPIGIALDTSGNVYTTNNGSDDVSRITALGASQIVGHTGRRPDGIALDASGNVYTANALSKSVSKIEPRFTNQTNVVALSTVTVAAPNNKAVWIIPFYNAIYATKADCLQALPIVRTLPAQAGVGVQNVSETSCMSVGSVPYTFNVGETEVTVAQWTTFLNTVDPMGLNRHHLWAAPNGSKVWPLYGSINRTAKALPGRHYTVASAAWAQKPFNFADFTRSARFINALQNGKQLSKQMKTINTVSGAQLTQTTYTIRLSKQTETGMYTMSNRAATRNLSKGFAVTSQDEWMKAAYFDPKGGGTLSYWDYPTNPGTFVNCPASPVPSVDSPTQCPTTPPAATILDPTTGNVTNAGTQPIASYTSAADAAAGIAPYWCAAQFTTAQCATTPFKPLASMYKGNLSTVGQALTRSPWGTLDQGGNTVEITDTIAPPPPLKNAKIVWRRWHGGVVTAPEYQMWLSAVGVTPQTIPGYSINPWRGLRIAILG